ncbi:hypothetical protein [Deinococcus multiflagellatus]|uniref:hypothetical protein n=1 Tax=Deinococcus multiflagellatus TaxID=1656887 RepID=UPI001CC91851|nr:hypothetical protein [Deinococcus multiflagellatus]MBZ9713698.1 hypothetical protein [Deinococcus multiflagellatus]
MKRLLPAFLGLWLAACGVQPSPPQVGELLNAPTALNVNGQMVTVGAAPAAGTGGFGVRVQLNSARSPLPPVRLDGVFVVGGEGLWKAPIRGAGTQATVWGRNAAGLQPGEPVQVVVRLLDDRGRVLWLRGAQTRVGQAP